MIDISDRQEDHEPRFKITDLKRRHCNSSSRNNSNSITRRRFSSKAARQVIKELECTSWLISLLDYLNEKVFDLSDFKLWLAMDHDCHAANTTAKIDKRHLKKIAVPPEIGFVNTMQAAVNYSNSKILKNFKLQLVVEHSSPTPLPPAHSNNNRNNNAATKKEVSV
jgi:hypothetical protein